jgi:hypothetical protein
MEKAARNESGTTLLMAFTRLYRPVPLLKYKGPAWVTGLLLLWWTGRLPSYGQNISCSKCRDGYRSRLHIIHCHRIPGRLRAVVDESEVNEFSDLFKPESRVHPIDQILQRLPVFSLENRRFRVVMAILKEVAYHDHRLNTKLYEQLERQLPLPPPPPDRYWRGLYPYVP